ncbi:MAG: GNAT family N-acetyltransferase [Methanomassiliicoccus sp.]|nr:GNAT family N-acetyltransferase [Methanomassiliicoccus sp.]
MAQAAEDLRIVKVDRTNVEHYVSLIKALADFESLDPPDEDGKARLVRDVTSDPPLFQAYLAMLDGVPVGYLAFYFTYSTFLARPSLFLEDIFVLEEHRKKGLGKEMFRFCVQEAERRGCGRMEWTALDWNTPAHDFYEGRGAIKLDWVLFRLNSKDYHIALGR